MHLIFLRHGESEANAQKVYSNRGWQHPLTEAGRAHVRAAAEALRGRGVTRIFTSPVRRAVESAEILGAVLGVAVEVEAALAEFDVGVYEGRPHEEGAACYADVCRRWAAGEWDARIPGGESCHEIRARFVPFVTRLVEQFGGDDGATIVLVGHGGTFCHALPMVLGNVTCAFAVGRGLGYGECVEAELRDGALRCVRWGGEIL